jgi:hypothetical protein
MADQKLDCRLWQHAQVWLLASGMEATSALARISAFQFCQRLQDDKKE